MTNDKVNKIDRDIEELETASTQQLNQTPEQVRKAKELDKIAQALKLELESANNRLRYAEVKLHGAHESLFHAQDVLKTQKATPIDFMRRVEDCYKSADRIPETVKLIPSRSQDMRSTSCDDSSPGDLLKQREVQSYNVTPGVLTSIVK